MLGLGWDFSYVVDGVTYEGSEAAKLDHRDLYFPGDTISVWYDPADPSVALLEPGDWYNPLFVTVMSLGVLVFGVKKLRETRPIRDRQVPTLRTSRPLRSFGKD